MGTPMDGAGLLRRQLDETREATDPLMSICLSCAVPLWIAKVRGWDPAVRQTKAQEAGHMIAYGAGAAAVGTGGKERTRKKRPNQGAAEVFNSIAMGLAILAFCRAG